MIRVFLIIFFGFAYVIITYGQTVLFNDHPLNLTIPEIALVDIEPNNTSLNLSFNLPSEAGLPIGSGGSSTDNSKWINYTNCLSPFVTSRSIEVRISNGVIPDGIELIMNVSSYSGSGAGIFGVSQGAITLTNASQVCINNIGGSFTGNGTTNGHQLTYSIGITNYDLLDAGQTAVIEIMFTLVDN